MPPIITKPTRTRIQILPDVMKLASGEPSHVAGAVVENSPS